MTALNRCVCNDLLTIRGYSADPSGLQSCIRRSWSTGRLVSEGGASRFSHTRRPFPFTLNARQGDPRTSAVPALRIRSSSARGLDAPSDSMRGYNIVRALGYVLTVAPYLHGQSSGA